MRSNECLSSYMMCFLMKIDIIITVLIKKVLILSVILFSNFLLNKFSYLVI